MKIAIKAAQLIALIVLVIALSHYVHFSHASFWWNNVVNQISEAWSHVHGPLRSVQHCLVDLKHAVEHDTIAKACQMK